MKTLIYVDKHNFRATIKGFWVVSSLQELDALPRKADNILLLDFSFLANSRDLSDILGDTNITILAVAYNDSIFDCLNFEKYFQTILEVA
ncbi:hypothetical protein [Enterococcus casseliflavus]|uniref:hypothetical protein n=1 Tax=Enterococcus casseliflavus TaxID=37734 RepID=UPI002543E73A|nr:hypothetical protein [Enterococcus casseliflavus]MDK4448979.1 hypothetical protein [Enterococcus casseliflavus]